MADGFRYCLNTSTIRGQKLSLVEAIDVAAKSGYDGIEPWLDEIERYEQSGGKLRDLAKLIRDNGLTVESGIGFAEWIVDDRIRRGAGLERARRDMDTLTQLGCHRMAAPPFGAEREPGLDLGKAAERYRDLLELGASAGVLPQLEVWGFSRVIRRLSEAMIVALDSGHRQACLLLDVYHLFKGGSGFSGLRMLHGGVLHVLHVNDYPRGRPRSRLKDADRVYPGDGAAPWGEIFSDLRAIGFHGALSLELFNPGYWRQDALTVAKTGLAKLKAISQNGSTSPRRSTPERRSASFA